MSEERPLNSYPNAFRFGCVAGVVMNLAGRPLNHEPLAARPFSYVRTALFFGMAFSFYDYWRRNALEDCLYSEEKQRYFMMVKGMNNLRYGEENDLTNLTEYLGRATTRD